MRTILCFTGMAVSMAVFSQQVVWEQVYDDSSAVTAMTVKFHESTQQAVIFASLRLYPDIISDPQNRYLKILSYDPAGNLLFDSTYYNISHPPFTGNVWETSGGKYAWAEEEGKRYMTFDPVSKQVNVSTYDISLYDIASQAHDGQNRLATLSSSGGPDVLRIVDEDLDVVYQDSLPLRYHSNANRNWMLFSPDGRSHMFWDRYDTIRYLKKSVQYQSMDSFDLAIPGVGFRLRDVGISVPDNRVYFYGRTSDGSPHLIMTDLQGNMLSDQVISVPGVNNGPFLSTSSFTINPLRTTPGRIYIFDETNYDAGPVTNDFLLAEYDRQGNHIRTLSGGTSDNPPHHPATGIIPLKNDEILVNYFSIQDTCSILTSALVDPFTLPGQVYAADTCDQLMWHGFDAGISTTGDFYVAYNQNGLNNSTDVRLVKFSKPNLNMENEQQEKNIHVFPNPFMEEIRVSADISQPTVYMITDVTGKMVRTGILTPGQTHTLQNLSSLAAGTYFLVISDGKTPPATLVKW